jgi:peptidyl-prolyl isomerase D
LEGVDTQSGDKPTQLCLIADCGELAEGQDDGVPEGAADGDKFEDYPEDGKDEWEFEELLTAAEEIRQLGNELFKASKVQEAVKKYEKALRYLSHNTDQANAATLGEKKVPCYSNTAMCYLKLEKWVKAKDACDKLLEIDNKNVKGYYRRAQALKEMEEIEEAEVDIKSAKELDPNDGAIKKLANEIAKAGQARKDREKKAYAKMF